MKQIGPSGTLASITRYAVDAVIVAIVMAAICSMGVAVYMLLTFLGL
jgi:hypothetical protein